jgi:hypothetical protein
MRTYALADESALLICSWPHNDRPKVPFPYFTEVMTGFEYQAAAHMIYEGLVEEGLAVVEAIRRRFDGERRNPWNEPECGHHYARAMASWAVILALSGFHYSAVERRLEFPPRWQPDDFQSIWAVPAGWGTVRQTSTSTDQHVSWQVLAGELPLRQLRCYLPNQVQLRQATLTAPTQVTIQSQQTERWVDLHLADPVNIRVGQTLEIRLEFAG